MAQSQKSSSSSRGSKSASGRSSSSNARTARGGNSRSRNSNTMDEGTHIGRSNSKNQSFESDYLRNSGRNEVGNESFYRDDEGRRGGNNENWNRPTQGARSTGYRSFDENDEGPIYGSQSGSNLTRSNRDAEGRNSRGSDRDTSRYDDAVHGSGYRAPQGGRGSSPTSRFNEDDFIYRSRDEESYGRDQDREQSGGRSSSENRSSQNYGDQSYGSYDIGTQGSRSTSSRGTLYGSNEQNQRQEDRYSSRATADRWGSSSSPRRGFSAVDPEENEDNFSSSSRGGREQGMRGAGLQSSQGRGRGYDISSENEDNRFNTRSGRNFDEDEDWEPQNDTRFSSSDEEDDHRSERGSDRRSHNNNNYR